MYSPQIFKAVKKAGSEAVADMCGDMGPQAYGMVWGPFESLIEMMEQKMPIEEILEEVNSDTSYYQYAAFRAASDALLAECKKRKMI